MQKIEISIICPLYYGQRYINAILKMFRENQKELLRSGMLGEIEIVFVNDAPEQKIFLPENREGISLKLIEQDSNQGIHQSRVVGFEHSKGAYVMFFDQDDKVRADCLVSQLSHIGQNDAVLCNGYYQNNRVIYSSGEQQKKAVQLSEYLTQKNVIVSPGQVLMRRDAVPTEWKQDFFKKNGSDDVLLWIVMLSHNKQFAVNDEKLYWHMESGENASYHFENMRQSIVEMRQRVLELDCLSEDEMIIFRKATEERLVRHERYAALQEKMERLHQKAYIDDLREGIGRKKIAIYGWGIFGRQCWKLLKKAGIHVCFAIDREAEAFTEEEIPLYTPEEEFPEADLVIVTPVTGFQEIKKILEKKSRAQIILLNEWVDMPETISVIIPVYNTAAYLKKCLDSVCGQTYQNLEIICVDDGSADGSEKIVDDYAEKDPRIKVIHKENGGESSARNTGLQNSTGSYVAFVDCDDWLEKEMYEKMVDTMRKEKLDMAACGYYWETELESRPIKNKEPLQKGVFGRKELFQYVYIRDRYRGVTSWIWCKLFKRELLYENGKMLEFQEDLRFGADLVFFIQAAAKARRVCYLEDAYYHYYQRSDSTAHTRDLNIAYDIVTAYRRMIDYLTEREIEMAIIPWLQRFMAYRASLVAEQAFCQKDARMLQKCQQVMKELEEVYFETNRDEPQRLERYRDIISLEID